MGRRGAWLLVGALLLGPGVALARADELVLADGERVFGVVRSEDAAGLVVETPAGVRRIARADLVRRRAEPAPEVGLSERRAALDPGDAPGRVALSGWALERGLARAAGELAREALAIDPEDPAARSLAGRAAWQGREVPAFDVPVALTQRAGRRHGAEGRRIRARHGGAAVDAAVAGALGWLSRHQEPDGSFDADGFERHDPPGAPSGGRGGGHHGEPVPCPFDEAVTAAALMAFLADGSTHRGGPHAGPAAGALAWCLARACEPLTGPYALLNRGHSVAALAEAYAVTRDPALRAPVERAALALLAWQHADGGFSYVHRVGDAPTSAVVGLALGQVARAGIPLPRGPLERLLAFLDARVDPSSGRSEYHAGAEALGYTPTRANAASGLAVRALLGRLSDAPHLGAALRAALGPRPRWRLEEREVRTADGRRVRAQVGSLYPLRWHHGAIALAAGQRAELGGWWATLKAALLDGQRQEGSAAGSWDPLGPYSGAGGRVFITALCVQMLRAPQRY